jgi:hypothetical protein
MAPYVGTVTTFTTAAVVADPDEVEVAAVVEVVLPLELQAAARMATAARLLRHRTLSRGTPRHLLAR